MLTRVCHVAFVLATLWLAGGVYAQAPSLVTEKKPDSDEVGRKAMESRVAQINHEVSEFQTKLQSESKTARLGRTCGSDVWMIEKRIDEATAKLETLEVSNPHASEVKTLKTELMEYRKVARAMEEQDRPLLEAFQRISNLRQRIKELEVERERLERDLKSMLR
ncbi:hypothetical protein [Roseimicrobium sp. ORNL1]|uniref:hypothetical protein n=1 Tax=Roseimicrobium sp. ORNL1 TaxID=2711231 RepID=UPI0013E17D73|nr:hypothetical protein [Roseimicrobium sp. ORNL1]QIF00626.1 hypothetical protein G5S37_03510 [Roseimicrobium sp. ORNL1]